MTDRTKPLRRGGSRSRVVVAAAALCAGLGLVSGMNAAASQPEEATTSTIRRVVVVPEDGPMVVLVSPEAPPVRPEPPAEPSQAGRSVAPVTESSGS